MYLLHLSFSHYLVLRLYGLVSAELPTDQH